MGLCFGSSPIHVSCVQIVRDKTGFPMGLCFGSSPIHAHAHVHCYMRTLLASSGSTLGHGSTTRTHACRRPPKSGPPEEAHAHTHKIYLYAVRRVCSAGAHPVASPPSPTSRRLASASLVVVSTPHQPLCPTPHYFFSPLLVKRRGPGGAHTQYPPPEWREYGRHGAWRCGSSCAQEKR